MLLIDDDESLVYFTRRSLEEAGFVVDVAVDGKQGLAAALTGKHDVILLDHELPVVMGIEILRSARDAGVRTPVIMITGKGSEQVAFEAARLGAVRYLTKPFWPIALIQEIREVLEARPSAASQPLPSTSDSFGRAPRREIYSRWAEAMVAAIHAAEDPVTLAAWAALRIASVGALRNWCRTAKVPAGGSLLLARVLRAIVQAGALGGEPADFLNIADTRTVARLLKLAGVDGTQQDLRVVLARQRLVSNETAVAELLRLLER